MVGCSAGWLPRYTRSLGEHIHAKALASTMDGRHPDASAAYTRDIHELVDCANTVRLAIGHPAVSADAELRSAISRGASPAQTAQWRRSGAACSAAHRYLVFLGSAFAAAATFFLAALG